jgi:hypothetical protein
MLPSYNLETRKMTSQDTSPFAKHAFAHTKHARLLSALAQMLKCHREGKDYQDSVYVLRAIWPEMTLEELSRVTEAFDAFVNPF